MFWLNGELSPMFVFSMIENHLHRLEDKIKSVEQKAKKEIDSIILTFMALMMSLFSKDEDPNDEPILPIVRDYPESLGNPRMNILEIVGNSCSRGEIL